MVVWATFWADGVILRLRRMDICISLLCWKAGTKLLFSESLRVSGPTVFPAVRAGFTTYTNDFTPHVSRYQTYEFFPTSFCARGSPNLEAISMHHVFI